MARTFFTAAAKVLAARFARVAVVVSFVALSACGSNGDAPTSDGGPDSALSCPLTCGAGQYCRFLFMGGSDGGCGSPWQGGGGWMCVDLPASCNGTPACACICGGCCTELGDVSFACPGA
jgi:hypothetical protein